MANDPINPNYYQFPSGAETIDITQFLTGNGAQATQYIVRSTRFDKQLKGNPTEDLRKAIWLCEKEIERLEEAEGHRLEGVYQCWERHTARNQRQHPN